MEKKKPDVREILSAIVFVAIIGMLFALNFIIPAPTVLVSERRIPARFPEFGVKTVLSGDFMSKFDSYAADRFVSRDAFRGIYAHMVFDVYMQTDMSGLYRSRNVGAGEFRSTNERSFEQTTERIKRAAESLDGLDMNIYYSMVPDKSIFAERYMPGFDLDVAEKILFDAFGDYSYIPLIDVLGANSFYRTDLHWDQSRISEVVDRIVTGMGAEPVAGGLPGATEAGEFKGVYAGQLALPMSADMMKYIDIPGLKVTYLNDRTLEFEPGPVYDKERFAGIDPYDMFLRGPQPLIVIENDSAPQRELFLFRDSFGSSLAPLLASAYSKVTVIDLRYIHLSLIGKFIEFTPGSDVLFIYGSAIFNNPSIFQA